MTEREGEYYRRIITGLRHQLRDTSDLDCARALRRAIQVLGLYDTSPGAGPRECPWCAGHGSTDGNYDCRACHGSGEELER